MTGISEAGTADTPPTLLKKTRVALMSSVHAPDDIRVFKKEGRSLAEAGFDVILVATARSEAGDISPLEGILIRAPRNRFERMTRSAFGVFLQALKSKASVCHFHDPELLPYAAILKICGRKVIYDVHEDLPKQVLSKQYLPKPTRKLISAGVHLLERSASLFLDRIVAATPSIAENFPAEKTILVQNYPLLDELFSGESQPYLSRRFSVAFVGGITQIRGAREMVTAIGLLDKRWEASLELAGKIYPPRFREELGMIPGWERVMEHGWRSRPEVAALLGRCRAGLVLYHPEPNHIAAQPNKLFEYMSAGLPIVASNFPLWKEIIEQVGCGLTVNPLDPKAIASALEYLFQNPEEAEQMGARGRRAVEREFNWQREAEKLISMYEQI